MQMKKIRVNNSMNHSAFLFAFQKYHVILQIERFNYENYIK